MTDDASSRRRRSADHHPAVHRHVFDLVRDPALRRRLSAREAQIIDSLIQHYRHELEPLGVFSRLQEAEQLPALAEQEQRELAALVIDIDEEYHNWGNSREYLVGLRLRTKRGPGHVRKLARKIAKIRKDLATLARDARMLDPFFAEGVVPYSEEARAALGRITLIPRGETVVEYAARMSSWYDQVIRTIPQPIDPYKNAATRLLTYLNQTAGLKGGDASVRTARIGKARWGWRVTVKRNDLGILDCAAIRALVVRRKKPLKDRRPPPRVNEATAPPRRSSSQGTHAKKRR